MIALTAAATAGELWCCVAEGLAGFLDRLELLFEAFENLFFVLTELAAARGDGFEVVDLLLYLLGVALR